MKDKIKDILIKSLGKIEDDNCYPYHIFEEDIIPIVEEIYKCIKEQMINKLYDYISELKGTL